MTKQEFIRKFFKDFPMIKKSAFANYVGINPTLMRAYASGSRTYVSASQFYKIESGIKRLGKELETIKLNR